MPGGRRSGRGGGALGPQVPPAGGGSSAGPVHCQPGRASCGSKEPAAQSASGPRVEGGPVAEGIPQPQHCLQQLRRTPTGAALARRPPATSHTPAARGARGHLTDLPIGSHPETRISGQRDLSGWPGPSSSMTCRRAAGLRLRHRVGLPGKDASSGAPGEHPSPGSPRETQRGQSTEQARRPQLLPGGGIAGTAVRRGQEVEGWEQTPPAQCGRWGNTGRGATSQRGHSGTVPCCQLLSRPCPPRPGLRVLADAGPSLASVCAASLTLHFLEKKSREEAGPTRSWEPGPAYPPQRPMERYHRPPVAQTGKCGP